MKSEHVKIFFIDWLDEKLSESEKIKVEEHLNNCEECKIYFNKLTLFFNQNEKLPQLEIDPFLPSKIKAIVESEKNSNSIPSFSWIKKSVAGIGLAAAILIGIFLGSNVAETDQNLTGDEIIQSYYQAFSQSTFSESLNKIVSENSNQK